LVLQINAIGLSFKEKIVITNTLDYSWISDFTERLLHGFIAGKDFIFTYGPLYQFLYSLPSIIFKVPSYFTETYSSIISLTIVFFIAILLARLITIKKEEQGFIFTLILVISYY